MKHRPHITTPYDLLTPGEKRHLAAEKARVTAATPLPPLPSAQLVAAQLGYAPSA
jgi:hypothetical protein